LDEVLEGTGDMIAAGAAGIEFRHKAVSLSDLLTGGCNSRLARALNSMFESINRMMWKAEGWLMGYNGGPIRHPASRVYDRDIAALLRGLVLAGLTPTADPDEAFFVGRHPT
jgi:hypothetical protein